MAIMCSSKDSRSDQLSLEGCLSEAKSMQWTVVLLFAHANTAAIYDQAWIYVYVNLLYMCYVFMFCFLLN